INQHPGVRRSVVLAREPKDASDEPGRSPAAGVPRGPVPGPGEKRLVAYFTARQRSAPTGPELRSFLKEKLPEYMVPPAFVLLETLPLTPNGKVDRLALPDPDEVGHPPTAWVPGAATQGADEILVRPRSATEASLAEIWEQVLGVHPLGVRDNFFERGGHSLLAVRLF